MQSTRTSRGVLIAILALAVTGLTALNIYQDHIIAKQRYELGWLMTHSTIRMDLIAADLAKNGHPAAQVKGPNGTPAIEAQVPSTAKPATVAAPAAKP
jgi:hypothetical protein